MKKNYIAPCVKIHQLKAKRRLLASSDPNEMYIRSNQSTDKQW